MKELKKTVNPVGTKRINLDLPPHVHDYLSSLHGTKKHNAEALLFAAARKNGFKPDNK